ncbi:MAG: PEP-CTERM sorting domain-containing protein [Gemmatimonadaceae bacterium]
MKPVGVFSVLSSLFLLAAPLSAQTIIVNGSGTPFTTPLPNPGANDPSCVGQLDRWCAYDVRSNASVGQTTANPRSGNGSLAFSSPSGAGKADFDYLFSSANQFKIKDLQSMSYDWFRNATSTNSAIQVPALRLLVEGPNAAYVDALVYEPYYQGAATPAGLWQTSAITTSSLFWWNKDCGNTFGAGPDYSVTLADWSDGHTTTSGACVSSILDNAKVIGFSVGVGSGWNGTFDGAVDNVSFRLNGVREATTYNFEVSSTSVVPEPSTYALMMAGLAALGVAARRRRAARV